jgi:hypothetical protein
MLTNSLRRATSCVKTLTSVETTLGKIQSFPSFDCYPSEGSKYSQEVRQSFG